MIWPPPLEKTHIAYEIETHRLAVIAKDDIAALLGALSDAGLSPDIICADYEACEQAQSFVYNDRLVGRGANGLGFAVETDIAPQFLEAGQNLPSEISGQTFAQRIEAALGAGHKPLNLRQGEFANLSRIGLGGYKRSALLAAGLALAFLAVNLGTGYNYARKTATLNAQASAIYTKLFPGQRSAKKSSLSCYSRASGRQRAGRRGVYSNISHFSAKR